jgi:hypothetical protein
MEKMVNRRLQYIIESRKLLSETEFGLRRNKSNTDVLITLENFIMEAIRKKEYTALLSLDIILTGIPKKSESERFRKDTAIQEK